MGLKTHVFDHETRKSVLFPCYRLQINDFWSSYNQNLKFDISTPLQQIPCYCKSTLDTLQPILWWRVTNVNLSVSSPELLNTGTLFCKTHCSTDAMNAIPISFLKQHCTHNPTHRKHTVSSPRKPGSSEPGLSRLVTSSMTPVRAPSLAPSMSPKPDDNLSPWQTGVCWIRPDRLGKAAWHIWQKNVRPLPVPNRWELLFIGGGGAGISGCGKRYNWPVLLDSSYRPLSIADPMSMLVGYAEYPSAIWMSSGLYPRKSEFFFHERVEGLKDDTSEKVLKERVSAAVWEKGEGAVGVWSIPDWSLSILLGSWSMRFRGRIVQFPDVLWLYCLDLLGSYWSSAKPHTMIDRTCHKWLNWIYPSSEYQSLGFCHISHLQTCAKHKNIHTYRASFITHINTNIRIHTHTHTNIRTHIHTHKHTHTHTNTHALKMHT